RRSRRRRGKVPGAQAPRSHRQSQRRLDRRAPGRIERPRLPGHAADRRRAEDPGDLARNRLPDARWSAARPHSPAVRDRVESVRLGEQRRRGGCASSGAESNHLPHLRDPLESPRTCRFQFHALRLWCEVRPPAVEAASGGGAAQEGAMLARWPPVVGVALLACLLPGNAKAALPDLWSGDIARDPKECDAAVRARPRELSSWTCYGRYLVTHREQAAVMLRRMDEIVRRDPDNPFATLTEGWMLDSVGDPRGKASYLRAEELFQRIGDTYGEGVAAISRLGSAAFFDEDATGWSVYAHAVTVADKSGLPEMVAWAHTYGAEYAIVQADFGRAQLLVEEARRQLTPEAPWWLVYRLNDAQGRALSATGRHAEALE